MFQFSLSQLGAIISTVTTSIIITSITTAASQQPHNNNNNNGTNNPTPHINRYFWVYASFVILWGILAFVWLGHIVLYRRHKIRLIYLMTVLPIVKVFHLVFALIFEYDCSNTTETYLSNGKRVNACFLHTTSLLHSLAGIPFYMTAAALLILISKAYGIAVARLRPSDKRSLIWNLICLLICLVAVNFTVFFQLPLLIMIIIIAGIVSTSILLNLRRLQYQIAAYRDELPATIRISRTPPYKKLQLLKRFQYLLTTFFFLELSVRISELLIAWNERTVNSTTDWLSALFHELLIFGLALSLAFLFRLRSFKNVDRFNNAELDFGLIQREEETNERNREAAAVEQLGFEVDGLELAKWSSSARDSSDNADILVFEHGSSRQQSHQFDPNKEFSVAFTESKT